MPIIAGHGAQIKVERNPSGSQGIFTLLGNCSADINVPALSRETFEVTDHEGSVAQHLASPVLDTGEVSTTVNFIYDDAGQDVNTGMVALLGANTLHGVNILGPGASGSWIFSGYCTMWSVTFPLKTGQATAEVSWRPTGDMIIDGVTFS